MNFNSQRRWAILAFALMMTACSKKESPGTLQPADQQPAPTAVATQAAPAQATPAQAIPAQPTPAQATPAQATPAQPAPQPQAKSLDANAIVAAATVGKPDGNYITLDNNKLTLKPHLPTESAKTTIQFPVETGTYRVKGTASLAKDAKGPVTLFFRMAGGGEISASQDIVPGESKLDMTFPVEDKGREIEMVVMMGSGATDNSSAAVTISDLEFVKE